MSTSCGKDGTEDTFRSSKSTREDYKKGLEISNFKDPFENPANKVEQWTNRTTGQINQKIVSGPDKGVHRYYDPGSNRGGQTGVSRFDRRTGDERRG